MQRMPIIGNLQLCVSGIPYKALDYAYMSSFTSEVVNTPLKDLKVQIDFEQNGSGGLFPSNLRTFNTFSTCDIYHTGKRLLDSSKNVLLGCPELWGSGVVYDATPPIVLPPGTYYVSGFLPSSLESYAYYLVDFTGLQQYSIPRSSSQQDPKGKAFTLGQWSTIAIRSTSHTKIAGEFGYYQVERGNTRTGGAPYNGTKDSVNLQAAESGAFYEGILNATTGDFVIDKVFIDLSTLVWEPFSSIYNCFTTPNNPYYDTNLPQYFPKFRISECIECDTSFGFTAASMASQLSNKNNMTITSSLYSMDPGGSGFPGITITYDGFSSYWGSSFNLNAFQAALENWQAVVTIPESQRVTLHLSPASFKTLSGINNVWSNHGKVALKYV